MAYTSRLICLSTTVNPPNMNILIFLFGERTRLPNLIMGVYCRGGERLHSFMATTFFKRSLLIISSTYLFKGVHVLDVVVVFQLFSYLILEVDIFIEDSTNLTFLDLLVYYGLA